MKWKKINKCVNAKVNYTLNESRVIQRMLQYVYRKQSKLRLLTQKPRKLTGSCHVQGAVISNKTDVINTAVRLTFCTLDTSNSREHSAVGIETRYWLHGPGIESGGRGGGREFLHQPERSCGPPDLLYNGYRVSIRRLKRPRSGVDHPHLQPKLKKEYSYTSTHPLACYTVKFTLIEWFPIWGTCTLRGTNQDIYGYAKNRIMAEIPLLGYLFTVKT
jgi:hypothetical protein